MFDNGIKVSWASYRSKCPALVQLGLLSFLFVIGCEVLQGGESVEAIALGDKTKIRGMVLAHIDDDENDDPNDDGLRGYGTAGSDAALTKLGQVNADWISLSVYGLLDNQCDTSINPEWNAAGQENDAAVIMQIRQAHKKKIGVLLSPTIWVEDSGWRGGLGECGGGKSWSDDDWNAFFQSYRSYLSHWAALAQAESVELLSLGLELKSTTQQRESAFIAMALDASKEFKGKKTYSANWDELPRLGFWSKLDFIGVNAFFPLTEKPGATLADLRSGAKKVGVELEKVSGRFGKRILFTEVGYKSCMDSAMKPWEWPEESPACAAAVSQDYQANAYRAVLETFWAKDYFAGMFWWKTFTALDDRTQTKFAPQEGAFGFDPIGKKAEAVLREFYQGTK